MRKLGLPPGAIAASLGLHGNIVNAILGVDDQFSFRQCNEYKCPSCNRKVSFSPCVICEARNKD